MEFVKDFENRLKSVIDHQIELKNAAGINVLVLKDGKEACYVQSGYADITSKKAFERDSILRMYSMTKPITGAAMMILVQRGLLSLSDPVSDFLPGFSNVMIRNADGSSKKIDRVLRVRDLLSMTSGLPYGDPNGSGAFKYAQRVFDEIDQKLYTDNQLSTVEIANKLGEAGLAFTPGESWLYGTSADICGAIVEVVTGLRYGEFLQKELFEPLEMEDTGFFVPEYKRKRLASAYERKNDELVLFETNHLGMRYMREVNPAFESGGAGLTSTIDDYAHFATMLIDGGVYKGRRIIDEAIVKNATSQRLSPWQEESMWRSWDSHMGYSYGFLMQHMVEPNRAYHFSWMDEYGWDGWLGTYFCNSPREKITILIGEQISNPKGNLVYEKVRNCVGACLT